MKLSEQTVNILKNFSTINQNILVKEGSQLRTMSTMKNILAEAPVTEDFPQDFGIYDLNEFLGVLRSLHILQVVLQRLNIFSPTHLFLPHHLRLLMLRSVM